MAKVATGVVLLRGSGFDRTHGLSLKTATSGQECGLGDLLEQLVSNTPAVNDSQSDFDNLINGMAQDAVGPATAKAQGSFGQVLQSQFAGTPDQIMTPSVDQEAAAGLMIVAILQAARLDAAEQGQLMDRLTGSSDDERDFVSNAFDRPLDVDVLAGQIPPWLESQVYMMSVLGVDLNTADKERYLNDLAGHMAIDQLHVDLIHDQLGVPRLTQPL